MFSLDLRRLLSGRSWVKVFTSRRVSKGVVDLSRLRGFKGRQSEEVVGAPSEVRARGSGCDDPEETVIRLGHSMETGARSLRTWSRT